MIVRLPRFLSDAFAAAAPALFGIEAAPFAACWAAEQLRSSRLASASTRITRPPRRSMPMNLKTIVLEVEETAIADIQKLGTVLKSFVIEEGQKLVALAKASTLGTQAMNLVALLESHTDTGAEKMAKLIAMITPAVQAFQKAGGLPGLLTSVTDFIREFAQSVYNDFKAVAGPLVLGAAQKLAA